MAQLGALLCSQQDFANGRELLNEAYLLGSGMAAFYLGDLASQSGDIERGITFWEEARSHPDVQSQTHRKPVFAKLAEKLGTSYCKLGRFREAVEMYEEAVAFRHPSARHLLDQMYDPGHIKKLMQTLSISAGQRVKIHGLRSQVGQSLNNLEGAVCCIHPDTGRIGVTINGLGKRAIKADNLRLLMYLACCVEKGCVMCCPLYV